MPDSQTLGLVIAGGIAGLICFRLYWVLGRRTGAEPQGPAPSQAAPALPSAPSIPAVMGGNGLLDIQAADHAFDAGKFLSGARQAYQRIIDAFAKGDRDDLATLVSPEVLAAFESAIAARGAQPPPAFVRLTDARIAQAALHGRHAEITVVFKSDFAHGPVGDVWSFARDLDSSDPNWTLVATSGEAAGEVAGEGE